MKTIKFKNSEWEYLRYIIGIWEVNPNISQREQAKEEHTCQEIAKKLHAKR